MASSTTATMPMADHYSYYSSSKTVSRLVSIPGEHKLNGNSADQPNQPSLTKSTNHKQRQEVSSNQQQQQQQQLPNYVKTFSQLLSSVGFMSVNDVVYYQLLSLFPVISNEEEADEYDEGDDAILQLENEESLLANQYKCDFYHHDCYFSSQDRDSFQRHLEQKHAGQSLYCFYCTKANHHELCSSGAIDHLQYSQSEELINHINSEHLNLKYQCNLCFYRAISVNHVFIHQAVEHLKCFEETLRRSILDKGDEQKLSLIEQQYLTQLNESRNDDDETEVEDEDDEDDEEEEEEDDDDDDDDNYKPSKSHLKKSHKLCKILVNGEVPSNHPNRDVDNDQIKSQTEYYFNQYGFKLEYPNLNETTSSSSSSSESSLIRCAYCMLETGNKESPEDIWVHCVSSHPHYPIIAYDLSQLVNSNKTQQQQSLQDNSNFNDGITNKTVVDLKIRMKKMSQNNYGLISQNIHKEHNYDASKFDLDNLGENLIENIITTFREHLASNTLPRSYDNDLMKKAFDSYNNELSSDGDSIDLSEPSAIVNNNEPTSSSNCSKGIKRKIVDDDDDDDEDVQPSSYSPSEEIDHNDDDHNVQQQPTAEHSSLSSNRQHGSIGWVAKRRRTLESYIPDSIKRRTKTLASMAATAFAAIGFYQLTNYLPESVQDYINN